MSVRENIGAMTSVLVMAMTIVDYSGTAGMVIVAIIIVVMNILLCIAFCSTPGHSKFEPSHPPWWRFRKLSGPACMRFVHVLSGLAWG